MTVQQRSSAKRQLQVDLGTLAQSAQVGSAERLRHDVCEKDRSSLLDHGKAAAIHSDAAPDLQAAGDWGGATWAWSIPMRPASATATVATALTIPVNICVPGNYEVVAQPGEIQLVA